MNSCICSIPYQECCGKGEITLSPPEDGYTTTVTSDYVYTITTNESVEVEKTYGYSGNLIKTTYIFNDGKRITIEE